MGEYNKRPGKISREMKDGTDIGNKALLAHLQLHMSQHTVIIFLHVIFTCNLLKPIKFYKIFSTSYSWKRVMTKLDM